VRDTGIGIAPEFLPQIFEMFTQGEETPEAVRTGLGIGLSLARSLVELHGGSIEASSAGVNRGSEFTVRLPIAEGPAPAPRSGSTPAASLSPDRPRRILVVDDIQDQAHSLARLLRLMGHEVRIARDGPAALEAAAEFVPDVALIDISLPGMDGYGVARGIRANPALAHVLLVAQTGWGRAADRSRSDAAGFDHHLVKPLNAGDVEQIIRSAGGARPATSG
jgi:CheY-like chemotaxis protein